MKKYVVKYYYKDAWHFNYFKTLEEANAFAYGVGLFRKKVSIYEASPGWTAEQGEFTVHNGGMYKLIERRF